VQGKRLCNQPRGARDCASFRVRSPLVASFVTFAYRDRKSGVNPADALVLQKQLYALDASLLASQVLRASEPEMIRPTR
jgi:hypothetical protein